MKYKHNLDSFAGPTPLFRKDSRGKGFQTFLAIDLERELIIFQTNLDYTVRVKHGIVVRIPIANNSTGESLRAWVQSEKVQGLVDRLIQETELRMVNIDQSRLYDQGVYRDNLVEVSSSKRIGRSVQTTVSDIGLCGFPSDEVELILEELKDDSILFLEQSEPVDFGREQISRSDIYNAVNDFRRDLDLDFSFLE